MALVLLDAGLVGLAISEPRGKNPARDAEGRGFRGWLLMAPHTFAVADVTRYEAEREWHRLGATRQLATLAAFLERIPGVEVTPEVWGRAAALWGAVRRAGKPTAAPEALDADAILAAVAAELAREGERVIIATTNVGHLRTLGADARGWQDIPDAE